MAQNQAVLVAGVPSINKALFHRIRFSAHDPAACIDLPGPDGRTRRLLVLRDVELPRARAHARADEVFAYADFTPEEGLSEDRVIAAAQAVAECLRRAGIERVVSDRTLPLIYVHELGRAGISVVCDPMLGVRERRAKDRDEIEAMRRAQHGTERAIEAACRTIADAGTEADGQLVDRATGQRLTSESVKALIDRVLGEHGLLGEAHIVAGGPQGGDCHEPGAGPLRTGEPIIVDVFPRDRETGYHGDCTRTVVHGEIPERVERMHAAVVAALEAGLATIRAGTTGEAVHRVAIGVIQQHGFSLGFPPAEAPEGFCSMPHGLGHGLGLDLKEPPLLDMGGPELVVGDAVTVEPGLYQPGLGGVRVEDLVVVTETGYEMLNQLPRGLRWDGGSDIEDR